MMKHQSPNQVLRRSAKSLGNLRNPVGKLLGDLLLSKSIVLKLLGSLGPVNLGIEGVVKTKLPREDIHHHSCLVLFI